MTGYWSQLLPSSNRPGEFASVPLGCAIILMTGLRDGDCVSMTKHELLLRHIKDLEAGQRISVRRMSREMGVSEGTAYRAIKEAEAMGLVSTVPRVGTIRIQQEKKRDIQRLTYAEVLNIVEGSILGGRDGLHKTLNRFLIGAMELDSVERYIEPNSLLIVGDREEVQRLALSRQAAVLLTGGFDAKPAVREIADRMNMPLISSSYDTFTIATMINQAINERMIKKEIVCVEDVLVPEPYYLKHDQRVGDWLELSRSSGHSRFPVVDGQLRVVGMITGKDVAGEKPEVPLDRVMTRQPFTVGMKSSVASAAHLMIWQGIELLPVVEDRKLRGVVTRQDVIKALQLAQRQPQTQMTHSDILLSQFNRQQDGENTVLAGKVPTVAIDRTGTVSQGALMTLMVEAAGMAVRRHHFQDMVAEAASVLFLHPLPAEQQLVIRAVIVDMGRHIGKVDVTIWQKDILACKAMVSVQSLDQ